MVRPEDYQRNERTKEPWRRSASQEIIKHFIIKLSSSRFRVSATEFYTQFVGWKPFTHHLRPSLLSLEALHQRCGRNTGWKPMLLCAVASLLQVHGDSFRDGYGRSLDSPKGQWSIGFQPVFCSRHQTAFFQHLENIAGDVSQVACSL
jgi:hypothetical protein